MRGPVLTVAAALLMAGVIPGSAGTIKKHQKGEERRIEQGEKSGKITPKEAERLENQQDVIDKEKAEALEDGKISKRERKDIRHDQKRLSQDIYHKKHNAKKMPKQ